MAELPVYYEARTVGTIEVHAEGPAFVYAPEWLSTRGAFPLSLLMPLSPRRVAPKIFLPWAANLLPEASQLRAIGLKLGAAPEDVIAILSEVGRDTAGALSVGKAGSTSEAGWRPVKSAKALQRILEELPSKPFLVGEDGVSMSLAGVQSKLGVAINAEGEICVPVNGAPSTYILKPDSERLFGGVQNEALCMTLARRLGLNAPQVTTGTAGKRTYLLVTRYDRIEQSGRWRRLHQEDFCQALGKPPSAKYESNQTGIPGPTLPEMFAVTRNAMHAPDMVNLLDYVIFNVLACNTDAHAKNYSLDDLGPGLQAGAHLRRHVRGGVGARHAQHGAEDRRQEPRRASEAAPLAALCRRLRAQRAAPRGPRGDAGRSAVLAETRNAAADVAAMPAGAHPLMEQVCEAIEERARALLSGLEDEAPATPPKTAKPRKRKVLGSAGRLT